MLRYALASTIMRTPSAVLCLVLLAVCVGNEKACCSAQGSLNSSHRADIPTKHKDYIRYKGSDGGKVKSLPGIPSIDGASIREETNPTEDSDKPGVSDNGRYLFYKDKETMRYIPNKNYTVPQTRKRSKRTDKLCLGNITCVKHRTKRHEVVLRHSDIPGESKNFPTRTNVRATRNTDVSHIGNQQRLIDTAVPSYVVMRHSLKPFSDNRRTVRFDMGKLPLNSHPTLTVEERPYIYIDSGMKNSAITRDRDNSEQKYPKTGATRYLNYRSPDQVQLEASHNSERHPTEDDKTNSHSSSFVDNNRLSRISKPGEFFMRRGHGRTSPRNQQPIHGPSRDNQWRSIEERIDGPVGLRVDQAYREVLPPELTNNHHALLQLLSSTGAEKLLQDLRTRNQHMSGDGVKKEKHECDCGPPTSTGTIVGLTGLAALLIYALSLQTITSASSSASGRSLMPNSHGYMESFMKDLSEEPHQAVNEKFPGLSWNQYRNWKAHSAYTKNIFKQLNQQRPFTEAFDTRETSNRRTSEVEAMRRSDTRPNSSSTSTKTSLLERIQRWIQGRGRRVYRTVNATDKGHTANPATECQCGLQQMMDLLSYVPLAVMLGYSTTISTTALTTGANTAATGTNSGATNIGVTINDADVITNSNNNAPTLTNTDSDVLSVVAQGSPVNTNTNTASNQDSDMISNSIIGGRRRRRRRNTRQLDNIVRGRRCRRKRNTKRRSSIIRGRRRRRRRNTKQIDNIVRGRIRIRKRNTKRGSSIIGGRRRRRRRNPERNEAL